MVADSYERPDRGRRGVVVVLALAALVVVGFAGKFGYRILTRKQYVIASPSMTPSLLVGDRIDCAKRVPRHLRRGSVVIVRMDDQPRVNVKRVVGLPGETLRTAPDGRTVVVDGESLAEPYADLGTTPTRFANVVVPEGHVFLLGDNRPGSADSRVYGPVARDRLAGVCSRIVAPTSRRGRIPGTP